MVKTMRFSLCVIAVVQFFFAVAFFLQLPFAVNLWPFPGTTPLTFIFISSIFAAAAAPTLWAAVTENYGVLAGIGLDYMGILLPVAVFSFQLGAAGDSAMIIYGIACILRNPFRIGFIIVEPALSSRPLIAHAWFRTLVLRFLHYCPGHRQLPVDHQSA